MENSKDIKRLELTLALSLMLIGFINRLIEGVWLPSISAYVDSTVVVGLLGFELGVAGTLLIYNGLGYKRHWYNVILGLSLWGVALFHYETQSTLHYIFASIFFIGSIVSISLSSNVAFKSFKYIVSGIILLSILLNLIWLLLFKEYLYSILVMETIGIIPFAIHFIVKTYSEEIEVLMLRLKQIYNAKK